MHVRQLLVQGRHCPFLFLEYPLKQNEQTFDDRQVKQKLRQIPVQSNVLLFKKYPAGHDVHWDKLV